MGHSKTSPLLSARVWFCHAKVVFTMMSSQLLYTALCYHRSFSLAGAQLMCCELNGDGSFIAAGTSDGVIKVKYMYV